MTRVLVADDQPLIRSALVALIRQCDDLEVVGEAVNGQDALDRTKLLRPNVVVMDIRMPVLDGLAATALIREHRPTTSILVLTTYELDEYVFEAVRAGASGFLLKDGSAEDLVAAIRCCAAGEAVMAPAALRRLFSEFARHPRPEKEAVALIASLTAREHEVLRLMADGRPNEDIAAALNVTLPTVKSHVGAVLQKLGVRDRTQATVVAFRGGL